MIFLLFKNFDDALLPFEKSQTPEPERGILDPAQHPIHSLSSWYISQSFLLIDREMHSQISVLFIILVLAQESYSLFIESFIGSFIPQTLKEFYTVSSRLELAHTGWQVPNVHISA